MSCFTLVKRLVACVIQIHSHLNSLIAAFLHPVTTKNKEIFIRFLDNHYIIGHLLQPFPRNNTKKRWRINTFKNRSLHFILTVQLPHFFIPRQLQIRRYIPVPKYSKLIIVFISIESPVCVLDNYYIKDRFRETALNLTARKAVLQFSFKSFQNYTSKLSA